MRIEQAEHNVRITVHNRGVAIAAEHLPRLFDRFYRADASRQESGVHHGLGLAIVAAIARMHGGNTFARSDATGTHVGFAVCGTATSPGEGLNRPRRLAAQETLLTSGT